MNMSNTVDVKLDEHGFVTWKTTMTDTGVCFVLYWREIIIIQILLTNEKVFRHSIQSPIHKDTVVHFITYLNTKYVSQVNVFRKTVLLRQGYS